MKHFIIADTHFNHSNIIEYCNRPFINKEEMNKTLIDNWNNVVGKEDIVYHLGDFGFGNKEYLKDIVPKLNGKIFLIKGNHDVFDNIAYERAGLIVIKYGELNVHKIGEANNSPIYATHHPPKLLFPKRKDKWIFFGHVHQNKSFIESSQNTCVSVERLNYTPLCLEDFFLERGVNNLTFYDHKEDFKQEKDLDNDITSDASVFIPKRKCKTLEEAIDYVKKNYTDDLDEEFDIRETYMRFVPIINPETGAYNTYIETTKGRGAMKGWMFDI